MGVEAFPRFHLCKYNAAFTDAVRIAPMRTFRAVSYLALAKVTAHWEFSFIATFIFHLVAERSVRLKISNLYLY